MPDGRRVFGLAGAIAAVAAPTIAIATIFPSDLMWLDTTATGGDMGSHNYAAAWLRMLLLGGHGITGWVPGNYGGFPLFQMYFPLPFVAIVLGSLVVGANVAFKLTSVAGLVALPLSSFVVLRRLKAPCPGPALGASLVLLFLFQDGNTMWGGNIASTLAGEFAYSISLIVALAYIGAHEDIVGGRRRIAVGAAIVAAMALTHAYTVLWVAATAGIDAILRPRGGAAPRRWAMAFAMGGALCAFWLLPLVVYAPWTTAFRHVWMMTSVTEILPRSLWPVVAAVVACPVVVHRRGPDAWRSYVESTRLLYAGAIVAALAYVAAPNFGIVDIRFLPFLQLSLCLLAAAGGGHVVGRWPARLLAVPVVFLGVLLIVPGERDRMSGWARWNYEGFERKPLWPVYEAISAHLRGGIGDPRVAFEHSPEHEALGTTRAFENLPLFSGRSTLEGVNMQASVTSPFVFYVQSEISEVMSCPFAAWGCSRPDLARGIEHLRMLHVSDVILRSDVMKAAAAESPELRLAGAFGAYEVHHLVDPPRHYVQALARAPYAVTARDWKAEAYRWFKRARRDDPLPVFVPDGTDLAGHPFAGVFEHVPETVPDVRLAEAPAYVETFEAERISVTGVRPGQPLLVQVAYHPRWRSATGERVWLAGPGFMLVFPRSDRLDLVYGSSWATATGTVVSCAALFVIVAACVVSRRRAAASAGGPGGRAVESAGDRTNRIALMVCLGAAVLLVAVGLRARYQDADVTYRRGQSLLDAGETERAVQAFRRVRDLSPLSGTAIHSTYFEAIAFYRDERWREAAAAFQLLVDTFPEAHAAAESLYHVGLCLDRTGDPSGAGRVFEQVRQRFPSTYWAAQATERLAGKPGR